MEQITFYDSLKVFRRAFHIAINKYEHIYNCNMFPTAEVLASLLDGVRAVCSIDFRGNTTKLDVYLEKCSYAVHEQGTRAAEMLISTASLEGTHGD
jgi:uncharacterized Fe-S radical SAM superfamily protein PflX